MSTTYDDLIRETPIWSLAENATLVEEMPAIIRKAEELLIKRLDHDIFQTIIAVPDLVVGNPIIDLTAEIPAVLEVRAIRLMRRGQPIPLERRNLETMSMLYSQNRPRQPRFYADYGDTNRFMVFPTPNAGYEVEVTANVEPLPLSVANQTNVLTGEFSRIMELAALHQAAIFMKDGEGIALFDGQLKEATQEANAQISRRRRDETGERPRETVNGLGQ